MSASECQEDGPLSRACASVGDESEASLQRRLPRDKIKLQRSDFVFSQPFCSSDSPNIFSGNPGYHRHRQLYRMSEDRGSVLTSNILAFGIAAFCLVSLRTSFRLYTRKSSASDWVLVVALVSGALPPAPVKESTQRRLASKPEIWPFELMIMRQISSLAQDSFNAACELCQFIVIPLNSIQADCSSSGVTQWGYGHHSRDLSIHIRSSPKPLKVSSSYPESPCKALTSSSFYG